MEKDMKFTTAGEWVDGHFQYDPLSNILQNFRTWWTENSLERQEMGQEPYSPMVAMEMFCKIHGGAHGITPELIVKEYEKAVDSIA